MNKFAALARYGPFTFKDMDDSSLQQILELSTGDPRELAREELQRRRRLADRAALNRKAK